VKVNDGGLEDAIVLTGAGEGAFGAKAYRILIVPGLTLIPHSVKAHTLTVSLNPKETAVNVYLKTEAVVDPQLAIAPLQTRYPVIETPSLLAGVAQEITGEALLNVYWSVKGAPGSTQLVAVRYCAKKSV
jgi:hypothetical protein